MYLMNKMLQPTFPLTHPLKVDILFETYNQVITLVLVQESIINKIFIIYKLVHDKARPFPLQSKSVS